MGLGILEDHKLENVPGTAVLTLEKEDQQRGWDGSGSGSGSGSENFTIDPRLKYDLSGPTPIVLVPQPSDDPNDPLNWPLWKRDVLVLVLCLVSILASTLGPLLAADAFYIMFQFKTTIAGVALLTGWHLFGVGVAGFLMVASARIWGKRHLYLLGALVLIISSVWGALATTYKSFLWARIIQGVAVAPFEALVNASVGDLYCVHQRGSRMALANLALFGGAFFTPVIVGITSVELGWRWTFKILAIFAGIVFPFVVLFVPETAYRRPDHLNTDFASTDAFGLAQFHHNHGTAEKGDDHRPSTTSGSSSSPIPEKVSFAKSLMPFNGRKTDDTFWKLVIRPLPLLLHPAIIWAMLTQGTLIGWTVTIGVDIAKLFIFPPVSFNAAEVGYTYTGAFIGAILGFLLSGLLSDYTTKLLTRLNKGVYEPEFRLLLVIPQALTGILGLFGFGFTMADLHKYGWLPPVIFFALEVMGMTIGAVASALYIVDAYRSIAIEAFTCMLLFKNFFSFGITWIAVDWLEKDGSWRMFMIAGCIQIGVFLLTVPLYIWGKRSRSLMYRRDILKWLNLVEKSVMVVEELEGES